VVINIRHYYPIYGILSACMPAILKMAALRNFDISVIYFKIDVNVMCN